LGEGILLILRFFFFTKSKICFSGGLGHITLRLCFLSQKVNQTRLFKFFYHFVFGKCFRWNIIFQDDDNFFFAVPVYKFILTDFCRRQRGLLEFRKKSVLRGNYFIHRFVSFIF